VLPGAQAGETVKERVFFPGFFPVKFSLFLLFREALDPAFFLLFSSFFSSSVARFPRRQLGPPRGPPHRLLPPPAAAAAAEG
jgi:hypothetical protein